MEHEDPLSDERVRNVRITFRSFEVGMARLSKATADASRQFEALAERLRDLPTEPEPEQER